MARPILSISCTPRRVWLFWQYSAHCCSSSFCTLPAPLAGYMARSRKVCSCGFKHHLAGCVERPASLAIAGPPFPWKSWKTETEQELVTPVVRVDAHIHHRAICTGTPACTGGITLG